MYKYIYYNKYLSSEILLLCYNNINISFFQKVKIIVNTTDIIKYFYRIEEWKRVTDYEYMLDLAKNVMTNFEYRVLLKKLLIGLYVTNKLLRSMKYSNLLYALWYRLDLNERINVLVMRSTMLKPMLNKPQCYRVTRSGYLMMIENEKYKNHIFEVWECILSFRYTNEKLKNLIGNRKSNISDKPDNPECIIHSGPDNYLYSLKKEELFFSEILDIELKGVNMPQ